MRPTPCARRALSHAVVALGLAGLTTLAAGAAAGCAGPDASVLSYDRPLDARAALSATRGRLTVRWMRSLGHELEGRYLPIERSIPAMDPRGDRIYVGSSTGDLWALTGAGTEIWMYHSGGGIGSQPFVDSERDELFFGSDDGLIHALTASTGQVRWTAEIGAAVGRTPVATDDTIYVVTESDLVAAFDRSTGESLWRYRREPPEGFYVTEHAGLTLANRRLLTGFTDGVVVAMDPTDGRILWERDTTSDLRTTSDAIRFTDVDTTPLVIGQRVFVASFAGGVYELELASGSVTWLREELTGVVGIAEAPGGNLLLSSGDLGMVLIDGQGEMLWRTPVARGAPTVARVVGDLVVYGETEGGLVALTLGAGVEVARVENGHGFAAPVEIGEGLGSAVSNAGALIVFSVR